MSSDYSAEYIYDQLKITAFLKGYDSIQFGTTLVTHFHNNRWYDGNDLDDHSATRYISCQGSSEQKLANLTTDDFFSSGIRLRLTV